MRIPFVSRDLEGNETTVELGGPRGEFRFTVGRPGEQCGIWKITASASVVVTTRGLDKDAKITLHREGDWWLAFHRKSRGQELTGSFGRTGVSWKPPRPNAAGYVHALSVWVPHGELSRPYDDRDTGGDITWLRPAAPDRTVGIHVVIGTPQHKEARSDGAFVVGFAFSDGRLLLIYRTYQSLSHETRSRVERNRAVNCTINAPSITESRCLVCEWGDYRPLYLWDLAGHTSPPLVHYLRDLC